MHERAPRLTLRVPCTLALIGFASFVTWPARAASVPGAELRVVRTPAARACPDEAALAEQLRARTSARAESSAPLYLDVKLDARGTAFVADLRVSGRKGGERSFRAEGPACDALSDVLVVSLSLLLDDDDEVPPARRSSTQAPAAPASTSGSLALGGAVTNALPRAWSSAWSGELALRAARWDFALAGFWAPEQKHAFAPGEIALGAEGARSRACFALVGRELRFGACAVGMLAVLRAEAEGFTSDGSKARAWWLAGAGPELRWFPAHSLSLGLYSHFLAGLGRQTFSVAGLPGTAFRTSAGSFWAGLDCSVQIW